MYRVVAFLLLSILVGYHAQNLPDYWNGRITTTHNGTMANPVPFKIYGESVEYNKKNSIRDNLVRTFVSGISSDLPTNMKLPSNIPPNNKSGTVSKT